MENVNKQLLERWAAFGKAMQKAGSELPRHLIADTEQAIAAAKQAQQADPVAWLYEMAIGIDADGNPIEWSPHVQMVKPSALYHTRNIRPLIHGDAAQPPAVAVLQAELDEWRKLLDPHTLHVNLCRGFPAKLTAEQLLHIAGDEKQQQAVAVAVPGEWRAAMSFARSALAEAIQIAPLDRLPRMAGAAMQQIDALLADAQKGGQ